MFKNNNSNNNIPAIYKKIKIKLKNNNNSNALQCEILMYLSNAFVLITGCAVALLSGFQSR